jgi:hypothetical protein
MKSESAVHGVLPGAAGDRVVTVLAEQAVALATARERVQAISAVHRVGAVTAEDLIVAARAIDDVQPCSSWLSTTTLNAALRTSVASI